jgi:hypothetical protein
MTRHSRGCLAALTAIAFGSASPIAAQQQTFGTGGAPLVQGASPGWTVTPSLLYSGSWDDNVLLHGNGDAPQSDFLNVLNPRGDVEFNGKRNQFTGSYDGAFLLYRDLNGLDSYDQHGFVSTRHLLTRHISLVASDTLAVIPTTEMSLLVGTPFLRTGSAINDFRGGVEALLTKRSSIHVSSHLEWVRFDPLPQFPLLHGGHGAGASASYHYDLTAHTAFTADSDFEHATVRANNGTFDVLNAGAGLEHTITDTLRVSGTFGISRLGVTELNPARTGPLVRARLTRTFRASALDVAYSRSFVPVYGFGGTTNNEDLSVRFRSTLWSRTYAQSSVSWRINDSLTIGSPSLHSWWIDGSIGYSVQPWMRLEGFYSGVRQTIDRPGGDLNRNRIGFQVVTGKPVRIR